MKTFKVFLLVLFHIGCFGQELDLNYQRFLGAKNNSYFFFQYGRRSQSIIPSVVEYTLYQSEFRLVNVAPWKELETLGIPTYKGVDAEIFFNKKKAELHFRMVDTIVTFKIDPAHDFSQPSVAASPESDTIFISANIATPIYMFDKKELKLYPLPLIGGDLKIRGKYLYFSAPHFSPRYSDYPKDVYRVHTKDLRNPTKVLVRVDQSWYPFSSDLVYARTYPDIVECQNDKCFGAFYDLALQRYAVAKKTLPTDKLIDIEGITYILEVKKGASTQTFRLHEWLEMPDQFPFEIKNDPSQNDSQNLFRYINMPLESKTFDGTFLTHQMMYSSSETELKQLTKQQLKIARNAFFALQGYKFGSQDLKSFFLQFDWYKKVILSDSPNQEVRIWPDEVRRVNLMKSIEE